MAGAATPKSSSDSFWPESHEKGKIGLPPLPTKRSLKDFVDDSPDFHDPYSDLNLFLSQKIKEEMKEEGFVKKWSVFLQEKLIEKITPEFQKKFPNYRLGVSAVRKIWDKISYYSQQMQNQKEALTQEGKLNVQYMIKENLKAYFHLKTPQEIHPYHYAHQLAMKISECLATVDGVRPMLDHLTKTIWSVQRHMLSGLQDTKSPYDEFDKFDRLIVKTILEITGKNPLVGQNELEHQVKEAIQSLHDLPSFASLDRVTANVSALLADKLYPCAPYHTHYLAEQKNAICNFLKRHLTLSKSSSFAPQMTDLVRRSMALYTLSCQLPKNLSIDELKAAVKAIQTRSERPELPQSIYAFISALKSETEETILSAYEETKHLPLLQHDLLEMVCWKIMSEKESLLEQLPYRIGQRIEEEIAQILIDNPEQSFSSVVEAAVQFFKKAKELALSKKWADVERKIHIWTIQGDLLCRWIRLDPDIPLVKMITDTWKSKPMSHAEFISEVSQAYFRKFPGLAPYSPQIITRISILYKYSWYALFAKTEESSFDRFLRWHIINLKHLDEEQILNQLEEICKKSTPLIPFDRIYCREIVRAR